MNTVQNLINRVATAAKVETARPVRSPPSPGESPPASEVEAAVRELKAYAAAHATALDFSVHQATGQTVIKVIDQVTSKVVREIPPEEILRLKVFLERAAGRMINTEA